MRFCYTVKIGVCLLITILFTGLLPLRASAAAAETERLTVLAFGDSLTAGYGLPASEGFPQQLEVWLSLHMDSQDIMKS